MMSRRNLLLAGAIAALPLAPLSAAAFEMRPYDEAVVKKAIASGKPVVLHVYASWCLQCRAQEAILTDLSSRSKAWDAITFFRIPYDDTSALMKALAVPRSTLIAYRGGKETGRMSWGMTEQSVTDVLKAAL